MPPPCPAWPLPRGRGPGPAAGTGSPVRPRSWRWRSAYPRRSLLPRAPDSDSSDRVANDPDADSVGAPDGYRYESWHDVTVVGAGHVGVRHAQPVVRRRRAGATTRVERPGGVPTLVACGPNAFGYGVRFQEVDNKDDFDWPLVQQSSATPGPRAPTSAPAVAAGCLSRSPCRTRTWPRRSWLRAAQRPAGPERLPGGLPARDPVVPGDHDDGLPLRRRRAARAERAARRRRRREAAEQPCRRRRRATPGPTVAPCPAPRPSGWHRSRRTPGSTSIAAR